MMAIKKTTLIVTLLLLAAFNLFSQQKITELKIGDKLPDLVINGIINRATDKVSLQDLYKDGLLIIDFWDTSCIPCIYEMKFLDSLKAKNPGKFNVLMVTQQSDAVIHKFLNRTSNNDIGSKNLWLATKDSLLNKMFIHKGIPHNIWIDKDGIVKTITSGAEVTTENVLGFNEKKNLNTFDVKVDNLTFDPLKEFHLGDTSFTYRSIITPYIPGIGGGIASGGIKPKRYFAWNSTMINLFWDAYSEFQGEIRYNLIEVNTSDSLKFFPPVVKRRHLLKGSKYKNITEWEKENTFCYALTLPKGVDNTVWRNYMFNDLNRQFNVEAKAKIKKTTCMIATKTKGKPLDRSTIKANMLPEFNWIAGSKMSIKNAKIKDILMWWFDLNRSHIEPYPYLVDLKKSEDFYFDVVLDFYSPDSEAGLSAKVFYEQLGQYGFRFKKQIRPYPILVLTDKN